MNTCLLRMQMYVCSRVRICVFNVYTCVCSSVHTQLENTCMLSDERVCGYRSSCVHLYTFACSTCTHLCVHVYTHVCSNRTRVCVSGEYVFVIR